MKNTRHTILFDCREDATNFLIAAGWLSDGLSDGFFKPACPDERRSITMTPQGNYKILRWTADTAPETRLTEKQIRGMKNANKNTSK